MSPGKLSLPGASDCKKAIGKTETIGKAGEHGGPQAPCSPFCYLGFSAGDGAGKRQNRGQTRLPPVNAVCCIRPRRDLFLGLVGETDLHAHFELFGIVAVVELAIFSVGKGAVEQVLVCEPLAEGSAPVS